VASGSSQAFGASRWNLFGNASFVNGDLQLTRSDWEQEGAGYFSSAIETNLLGSFALQYSFVVDQPTLTYPTGDPIPNAQFSGADGIGMTIRATSPANLPNGKPDMIYDRPRPVGSTPSLAINADTWSNSVGVEDDTGDPPQNYLAMFINRRFAFNQARCSKILPTANSLRDFRLWTVWAVFNQDGTVFVNASNVLPPGAPDTGALAGEAQMTVDFSCTGVSIPDLFPGINSVYIGFTAQTGTRGNRHTMKSFLLSHCGGPNAIINRDGTCTCTSGNSFDATTGTCQKGSGDSSSSSGLSIGAIVGIVVGALAAIALVGGLIYYFNKKKASSDEPEVAASSVAKKSFTDPLEMASKATAASAVVSAPSNHVDIPLNDQPPPVYGGYANAQDMSFNDPTVTMAPAAYVASYPMAGATIAAAGAEAVAGAQTGQYTVVRTFIPTNEDEIVLSEGNLVMVEDVFADGLVFLRTSLRSFNHSRSSLPGGAKEQILPRKLGVSFRLQQLPRSKYQYVIFQESTYRLNRSENIQKAPKASQLVKPHVIFR
jgi:hypothetical protein